MRKQIIGQSTSTKAAEDQPWIEIAQLARVEVSSEALDCPVEAALIPGMERGWKAAGSGKQTIRLLFDEPQSLRHVRLMIDETRQARTQEFVLRWSADGGRSYREIVRQQYHFSPPGTTQELEEYTVNLEGVTVVELELIPDIAGGNAIASLRELRLA